MSLKIGKYAISSTFPVALISSPDSAINSCSQQILVSLSGRELPTRKKMRVILSRSAKKPLATTLRYEAVSFFGRWLLAYLTSYLLRRNTEE